MSHLYAMQAVPYLVTPQKCPHCEQPLEVVDGFYRWEDQLEYCESGYLDASTNTFLPCDDLCCIQCSGKCSLCQKHCCRLPRATPDEESPPDACSREVLPDIWVCRECERLQNRGNVSRRSTKRKFFFARRSGD